MISAFFRSLAKLPRTSFVWQKSGKKSALLLIRAITFGPMAMLLLLMLIQPSMATTEYDAVTAQALLIRNPDDVLLIKVAKAGDRLVAVGAHGVVVLSDDNGKTWRQAAVVPTGVSLTCVSFQTPLIGWAGGDQGVVLHTIDGGVTWTRQLTGGQVIPLMLTAANQAAAANPSSETAQRAVRRANIFVQAGPDKPFLSVLPLSQNTAILFGAYRMTVRTDDGGKNWLDWSLRVADPISHNLYDSTVIGSSIYVSGEMGAILQSQDQGMSFSLMTSPDPSTFLRILGTPRGTLLTFGVAGEVFRSTDQAKTWQPSNIVVSSDLTGGVVLKSGAILVISEDGNVYISKDDGVTFVSTGFKEPMALFDVTQANNGSVIFLGSGGVRVVQAAVFQ